MSSDVRYPGESGCEVFLVAFSVQGMPNREDAEDLLLMHLPRPRGLNAAGAHDNKWLDSWWLAEDERRDGSDCDSAVFVPKGQQKAWATMVKDAEGECPKCFEADGECKCAHYEEARITITALSELLYMDHVLCTEGWNSKQIRKMIDDRLKEL